MRDTPAEVLSVAQRSLAAAAAGDRGGWIGLFTADARVEDPVGSAPHCGHVAIGRFFDTYIGPREISHRPGHDIVVGTTVIRDVTLEITMAAALTMQAPTYIRCDVKDTAEGLRIAALSAYWELPTMIGQFVRGGVGALPAGLALGRAMFVNRRLGGSMGLLRGFAGTGTGSKAVFERFLDDACGGDEVGVRRRAGDIVITVGDADPLTASELLRALSGASYDKVIRSGRSVAARVRRGGRYSVVIGELGPRGAERAALSRIRLFDEAR